MIQCCKMQDNVHLKRVNSLCPPPLELNGTLLDSVSSYKYLGVTLTSDLSWLLHITNCCNTSTTLSSTPPNSSHSTDHTSSFAQPNVMHTSTQPQSPSHSLSPPAPVTDSMHLTKSFTDTLLHEFMKFGKQII